MNIEVIDYIGQIKNDTGILGKAFIFNIEEEDVKFDCILFVHEKVTPFVSLPNNIDYDKDKLLKEILTKYTIQQLLEA